MAWYSLYVSLGGDPHLPAEMPLGRFLRKLLIWTPFRALFAFERGIRRPKNPLIGTIAILGLLLWAHRDFAGNAMLLLALWGLFYGMSTGVEDFVIAWDEHRVPKPGKTVVVIPQEE